CISITTLAGLRIVHAEEANLPPAKTINPADVPPGARVLHFPAGRPLGRICTEPGSVIGVAACGDVLIPAGKQAQLRIHIPCAFQDLSPLRRLGPNDIDSVHVEYDYGSRQYYTIPAGFNPDSILRSLECLKGLKALNINNTNIPAQSLARLRNFPALEDLETPKLNDAGMAVVCGLTNLKKAGIIALDVTDASLKNIARLTRLESLSLVSCKNVSDKGLRNVPIPASVTQLELVIYAAQGSTLVEVARRLPNLKCLKIQVGFSKSSITNQDLSALASSGIEELDLGGCDCSRVTDDGIAALKPMRSLRKIVIGGDLLTDRAAEHLAEIKTLESVSLKGQKLTDNAAIALARLPKLKSLDGLAISRRSLEAFAAAGTPLEDISYGLRSGETQFMDDDALATIARLGKLKKLALFTHNATNEGLARLTALQDLEDISIYNNSGALTIGGLNHLNALKKLNKVGAFQIVQDDSGLDLSGLAELQWLHLSIHEYQSLRDEDLAGIAHCKNLTWLGLMLTDDRITDHGMANLAELTSLQILFIGSSRITGLGVKPLAHMPNLFNLTIRGKIDSDGLAEISKLKTISILTVATSVPISPEAMDRVKTNLTALQQCVIGSDEVAAAAYCHELLAPGKTGYDFKATTPDGKTIRPSKLDKIVMLHFWASWSKPCRAEIAQLKQVNETMTRKFGDKFALLSVSIDQNPAAWKEFIQREGMSWPQARLKDTGIPRRYGINQIPAYYLLAPDGKVLLNPESSWKNIDAVIEKALK
ncbi:MAG: thioredoxin-like domain-containing protein, partial [Candidatus Sumerlaeia bacterium]